MDKLKLASALASVLLVASAARAAETGPVAGTLLTVVAEGRVSQMPDVAEVSGGVVTTATTAAAAMAENARAMTAMLGALRKAGVATRDIQTRGLGLQPQYRYEQNRPPELTGYQATSNVGIVIRRIADTGRLLDTLAGVGANQISGPEFRVEASEAALDEARVKAIASARARALLYARAAGLTVKRIVGITEGMPADAGPRPMMMMAKASEADSTPVAPGEVALAVTVTVQFELQ